MKLIKLNLQEELKIIDAETNRDLIDLIFECQ